MASAAKTCPTALFRLTLTMIALAILSSGHGVPI